MRHILKKLTFSILVCSKLLANEPTDEEIFGDTLKQPASGYVEGIKVEPKEWNEKDTKEIIQEFISNDEALERAIGNNLILQDVKIEPDDVIVGLYGFYSATKMDLSLVADADGKEFLITDGRFLFKCSVKSGDEKEYDFAIELTDRKGAVLSKLNTSIVLEDKHPLVLLRHDRVSESGESLDLIFWAYQEDSRREAHAKH